MGVDTSRIVLNSELDADQEHLEHGEYYAAASYSVLYRLCRQVDFDRFGRSFIDFGCGRGRAMAVAGQLGFRPLIGVEYSLSLCESARRNLARLNLSEETIIEVLHLDAREYQVPSDAQVFYFFNPFDAVIMRGVIDNILDSVDGAPRDVCVIYVNSVCLDSFLDAGFEIAYSEDVAGEPSHILVLEAKNRG